jgi:hypothetical protein
LQLLKSGRCDAGIGVSNFLLLHLDRGCDVEINMADPAASHVLTNATAGSESEVMCLWVSLLVSVVVLVDGLLLMKEERR